jgi:ABC-type amino acid transport substrate-binding protein
MNVNKGQMPNLIELIIPENLFAALSNNYVPAVILFCIIFAIMLQRVNKPPALFRIMHAISHACIEFWHWIIKLAPFGIFTIFAYTAGTIRITQLRSVAEYLILFTIGVGLLAFWLIPAIISSFTDIRYRTLLTIFKNVLIIAASTKISILALPYIKEATQKLLHKENLHPHESSEMIETILLIGYPIGQLGNFFVYLFILFAGIYYNQPLTHLEKWLLPTATYLSAIGSPHATENAVNFLTSWLKLPDEARNLFSSLTLLTEYGQVLVSVMGFIFLSILVSFAYFGKLKLQLHKAFTHLVIVALIIFGAVFLLRGFIPQPGIKIYQRLNATTFSPVLTNGIKVTMRPPLDETHLTPVNNSTDSLLRIQKTGILRVGYNADTQPYVYFNTQGQLVGFDVGLMYALAKSLNSRIEFIPFTWRYLIQDMQADKFDIAIGGLYVTSERLQYSAFTDAYLKTPLAFIIPLNRENDFNAPESLQTLKNPRIATLDDPVLVNISNTYLPQAQLILMQNINTQLQDAFAEHQVDAALWDQSSAQIWALGHPGYIAVVTPSLSSPFLIAYMVQRNSPQFLGFLNYWLRLKDIDGLRARLYAHWMLGGEIQVLEPRWNIMHDVLGWGK